MRQDPSLIIAVRKEPATNELALTFTNMVVDSMDSDASLVSERLRSDDTAKASAELSALGFALVKVCEIT